jgi:hypothetical protein
MTPNRRWPGIFQPWPLKGAQIRQSWRWTRAFPYPAVPNNYHVRIEMSHLLQVFPGCFCGLDLSMHNAESG